MTLPSLITDREFAAMLKLSKEHGWRTIQILARSGKLKGLTVRIGNRWRFREDKVAAWIARGGMQ